MFIGAIWLKIYLLFKQWFLKKVEILNKTLLRNFQTALIIESVETKSILVSYILFYNYIYLNDISTWLDVLKLQIYYGYEKSTPNISLTWNRKKWNYINYHENDQKLFKK